ncbi:MAG TPA: M14 family zinc carboxypeptidase [Longimicrobiales bacterium]
MSRALRVVALVLVAACGHAPSSGEAPRGDASFVAVPAGLAELHAAARVPGLELRTFDQAELWHAIGPLLDDARHLRVEEIGRSAEGRPLRSVTFGSGATRVLMWSQMHGDESTATMALADLYAFIERNPTHPIARTIMDRLTVTTIPMLNPDGAERFQRRNAFGVDVNRDARALATPEGRTLKAVFDRVDPDFAFNLHDQDVGTRLGDTDEHVAIALLAPAFDESRAVNDVRRRAMRVAGVFRSAIEPLVGGHVARYDDTFNPRAFGDLTTTWGASAVLVESGAWPDDPEKQHLRRANFVGLLAALHAIADGSYADADDRLYTSLPENGRSLPDLLVAGGTLVLPGLDPVRADLMIEFRNGARRTDGYVSDIGDLAGRDALDTLDISGLFVMPSAAMLEHSEGPQLQPGAPARFQVSRTPNGPALWRFEGSPPAR